MIAADGPHETGQAGGNPMFRTASQARRADAPARDLLQHVPLEWAMAAFAIILAAGLKLAGILP